MVDNVEVASTEWHLRRRAVPITALGLMTCAWLVLQALPPDRLDRGMRNTFSFVAGMIAAIVVGVWFFGMAGVPRRTRGIAAVALLLLVGGFLASVRNVEFSGDMEPTFDFRWQPSRESKLAAYLASEKKASASSVKKVAAGSNHGAAPIDGSVADVAHSDSAQASLPSAEDSPRYRGAGSDGIVIGPTLARDWTERPPRCLWRHPCGGGYASFAVIGDAAVTLEQRGPDEAVVCYDVSTGRHRWAYAYPALFSEKLGGDGPRATPAIHGGCVYSLGASGDLLKLDFATGKLEWRVNILAENGSGNVEWGMSGSPLVFGERVVVNPARNRATSRARTCWDSTSRMGALSCAAAVRVRVIPPRCSLRCWASRNW